MSHSYWRPWLTSAATVLTILSSDTIALAKTYTQHGNALANYNVKQYRTVNNHNYFKSRPTFTSSYRNIFQTTPTQVTTNRGKRVTFRSNVFLPTTYQHSADWGNPQSAVLTQNGNTLYEMITSHNNHGRVIRYNLAALRKQGISSTHMDALRRASYDHSVHKETAGDKAILKNVKVGPTFNTGHGQSLALNPKNGQLWFVGKTAIHSNVQQVSTRSLKPVKKINFMLKSTVPMGENLTFDKKGNAYFYTYSGGGWAPKGTVKIYQGKIYSKSVKFHLVMQGLRHNPGTKGQSIGYNPHRNRLYFVSDGSIASIPLNKLGHLKASQVEASNFSGHREFEGLQFTSNGNAYLLSNRGPELLKASHY